MDNKSRLWEAGMAACLLAVMLLAFALMVGDSVWPSRGRQREFPLKINNN